jgi:hypothetical protein
MGNFERLAGRTEAYPPQTDGWRPVCNRQTEGPLSDPADRPSHACNAVPVADAAALPPPRADSVTTVPVIPAGSATALYASGSAVRWRAGFGQAGSPKWVWVSTTAAGSICPKCSVYLVADESIDHPGAAWIQSRP